MIQVSTLLEDLKFSLGSIFGTDAHPGNKPLKYLNSSLLKVVRAGNFPFFYKSIDVSVLDSVEYNSVDYDILECIDVTMGGEPVNIVRIDEFLINKNRDTQQKMIAALGNKIYSNFVGDIKIVCKIAPTRLTATSAIDLPDSFFDILFNGGMYYGSLAIKDFERVRQFEGDFNTENTRLRALYTETNPSNSTGVGRSYSEMF